MTHAGSIRRFLVLLLCLALCLGLSVAALAADNTGADIRLMKAEGTVTVTSSSGKTYSTREDMKLYNGYVVTTAAESYAWITLDGTKAAKLDASSSLEVRRSGKELELLLRSGRVFFNVTVPLTEEEKRSFDLTFDEGPKTFTGGCYSEAYEKFMEYCMTNHLGDGLALAPPTKEAVEWMLSGTSYPRDRVIGLVEPKLGKATVEKIAIAAVMAGAKPEWLPVIIAIMEVLTDPGFNQFHIVNEILPAIFVSGPIVKELGLNNKVGYLAPGTRANSAIGRAVLMCMITIGWRDMTIYASPGGAGRPAAYANIFVAENQEESPWESWAEQNGFGPEESVVTACEFLGEYGGPAEIVGYPDFDAKLAALTKMFGRKGGAFASGLPPFAAGVRLMLVMHPTLARQLAARGFTKQSLIQYLYDQNVIDYDRMTEEQREALREELRLEGLLGRSAMRPEDVKPGLHREPFSKPEHLMVFVSGSGSGQTQLYYTSTGSTAGIAEGIHGQRPWMTKAIRGAALTKYGR